VRVVALLAIAALAAAVVALPALASARQLDGATIVNSGSTNSAGFRLDVRSDGSATFTVDGRTPESRTVLPVSVALFIKNLKASLPLSPGKSEGCVKSASFGTSTFVIYHGHRSGDISCGTSLKERTLMSDVNRIALEAKIPAMIPRAQVLPRPLPPTPEPNPTSS
jgi:hypothetical protein